MDANFELFEEGQVELTRERVHVTLNGACRLFFNARALGALGDPDGVALLFDRQRQIIGVMPAALNRKHAYRLRHREGASHSRVITVKNFCRHYAIKPEGTLAFPSASVNKDGILMLDLQQAEAVTRQRRNATAE